MRALEMPMRVWSPLPFKPALSGPGLGQAIHEPAWLSGVGAGVATVALIWAGTKLKPRTVEKEGRRISIGNEFLHYSFLLVGTVAGMKFLHELSKGGI